MVLPKKTKKNRRGMSNKNKRSKGKKRIRNARMVSKKTIYQLTKEKNAEEKNDTER
jgi:hypothetical protein